MGKKDKKMVPALADSSIGLDGAAALEKAKKRKKDGVESLEQGAEAKKLKMSIEDGFEGGVVKKEKKQKKNKGLDVNEEEPSSSAVVEEAGEVENIERKKKKKKKGLNVEEVVVNVLEPNGAVSAGQDTNGKQKKKEKKAKQTGGEIGGDVAEIESGADHKEEAGSKKKKAKKEKNGLVEETMANEVFEKKKKKDKGANGSVGVSSEGGDLGSARAALNMVVTGRDANTAKFRPLQTFDEANLPEVLLHGCAGFASPSPIQAQAWPIALAGRDLIGIAKTGSGKTIAFAVPALSHITKLGKPPKSPACLVLAPTRELAIQIAEVFENAGKRCGVKTVCVYGGVPKGPQKAAIRAGATVVVATPGRLQDLVDEGACAIGQCGMLVLDEADRMLDLGFEPAIRKIIGLLPKAHQTSMFSATWPPEVAKLAAEFLRDPLKITIGSEDLTANHDVTQIVEVCEPTGREPKLEQLLRKYHADRKTRVLVFVLYKKEAAQMETYLTRKGWKAVAIHGDKGQADRSSALQHFRDGTIPLLIATDVAARGLDIPNVEYVINYSFPLTAEDYVHRIGRTGRAGKKGIAHTFFTVNDKARAGELQNILREAGQPVPEALTAFGTTVKKKESKLYGAHFREVDLDAKATKISFDSDDE